jgi:putative MATE family efflux protein
MQWDDREKIAKQSIGRSLVSLAVPAVTSTFFTVVFEIIDMYWIGKLEADSIAALSGASFFIWMTRGVGLAVAAGTIALVSRRTGEKDEDGLLKIVSNAVGSSFVFSLFIMVVFLPPALGIFKWVKLDPAVAVLAEDYTSVFLSGLIFVYMMMTVEFIIRGIGDTRTPMKLVGISLLLNAILDPLFIFTFGMGLKGAAYATILSQCIGAVLLSLVLLKKIPRLKTLRFSMAAGFLRDFWKQFFAIIKIGGPIGISDAGFSFIYLLLSGIISIFGKEPLAAVGISHRLEALPFFICLGFSMAVEPMVGQFLGAGKPENARKSVYLSLKITTGIIFFIVVVYFITAPALYRFFTDDPAIVAHGVDYLRIVVLSEFFLVLEVVLTGAFSGAGDTRPPFLIVFPITFARIPLAYLFAVVFGYGAKAIWAVIGFTTFLKGILLLNQFRKGRWAKKKI